MKDKTKKIIYISHDGILDPLGQSQILQYLESLTLNYRFFLITLEKEKNLNNKKNLKLIKEKMSSLNIIWINYTFVNSGLIKTVTNFYKIFKYLYYLFKKEKIEIVHIRSYLPGFYIIPLKFLYSFKLIFDIRGFLPEEKIDRLKIRYISFKFISLKLIEKILFKFSEEIITLTYHSKKILENKYKLYNNKITVIPTCVDINLFKPIKKTNSTITIGYIGNISGAYNILPILKLFKEIIKINSNIILKIYTNEDYKFLINFFHINNISDKNYLIQSVNRNELISIIPYFDVGIFNLNINYSIKASFPTKIAEFLSSGIPIICNNFNNDINDYIIKNDLGLIVNFEEEINNVLNFYNKLIKLKNNNKIKDNCRIFCSKNLSVNIGSNKYKKIYEKYL